MGLSSKTRDSLIDNCEEGTKDIRLAQTWVGEMKQKMAEHKNKHLKHLYGEFEKLKTVQIAVYFSHLAQYNGTRNGAQCEAVQSRTLFASIGFSRALFRLIIHDRKMRKYLAYRGLRSQPQIMGEHSGKWGTIIRHSKFCRETDESKPSGTGWRWIADAPDLLNSEGGMCYRIRDYSGQAGNYFSVYESKWMTK